MMKQRFKTIYIICISFLWALSSCTKFADPEPIFEDDAQEEVIEDRRVLYISIDGAVGEEVRAIMPPTISSILPNSKYSFNGISEVESNDGTTWTSVMTGVKASRHHVQGDDFAGEQENGASHDATVSYPTIFYRLMVARPYDQTFAIVANPLLLSNVMREARDKFSFASDAEVKDKAVDYLKTTKSKFGVISFSSVKKAGLASSFSASNPVYADAVTKVDSYLKDILKAVDERVNRKNEKWMIIIQSNNGGRDNVQGGASFTERNIFSIYYYPTFKSKEYKPDITSGVRLYSTKPASSSTNANLVRNKLSTSDASYLDMTGNEMTVEFSYILNRMTTWTSQSFILGKSTLNNQSVGADNGWGFIYRDNGVGFFYKAGANSTNFMLGGLAPKGSLTSWIHCAAVIKNVGTGLEVSTYQNGVLLATTTVPNATKITASSKVFEMIGRDGHNSTAPQEIDMSFRNVRVWDKALTTEEVKAHACMTDVSADLPYIDKLIANYPLNANGTNLVSGKPNLTTDNLTNYPVYSWNTICSTGANSVVMGNTDLAPAVFYWLRLDSKKWTLDGRNILVDYEDEFYSK